MNILKRIKSYWCDMDRLEREVTAYRELHGPCSTRGPISLEEAAKGEE